VRYSSDNIDLLMDHHIDVLNRRIYMWDRFDLGDTKAYMLDGSVSLNVIKGLAILSSMSQDPVVIEINSAGGYVHEGYAVYDAIRRSPCRITAEVTGNCSSAATLALLASDYRLMHPSSFIMVHDGSLSMPDTTPKAALALAAFSVQETARYHKILADVTGKPVKFWEDICKDDRFILPEEARRLGLIHKVLIPKPK
jgi:ATP-dependent protease ClpP protease subunit